MPLFVHARLYIRTLWRLGCLWLLGKEDDDARFHDSSVWNLEAN